MTKTFITYGKIETGTNWGLNFDVVNLFFPYAQPSGDLEVY